MTFSNKCMGIICVQIVGLTSLVHKFIFIFVAKGCIHDQCGINCACQKCHHEKS